jgi:predicted ATPase
LALSRLGRRDGADLVKQIVGNAPELPADVIEEIIERTDGVPLFLVLLSHKTQDQVLQLDNGPKMG